MMVGGKGAIEHYGDPRAAASVERKRRGGLRRVGAGSASSSRARPCLQLGSLPISSRRLESSRLVASGSVKRYTCTSSLTTNTRYARSVAHVRSSLSSALAFPPRHPSFRTALDYNTAGNISNNLQ